MAAPLQDEVSGAQDGEASEEHNTEGKMNGLHGQALSTKNIS
jgi:hypothetical protein